MEGDIQAKTWPVMAKDNQNLYRVTYTSRIRDSTFSVHDIVRQSKQNNQRLGVGGVLQYNQSTGEITQILEGQEAVVKELLDKISGDWRHSCVEIQQEEWPKKRVWHKWGGMLLSHGGHWKVVRSPCRSGRHVPQSPPTLRMRKLRPKQLHRQFKNEEVATKNLPPTVEENHEADLVVTPFGNGRHISLEKDEIMKIKLKFGTAYIHQSNLALPPKARDSSVSSCSNEADTKVQKWTVALIDKSQYIDGEQDLMYVFTRKPVGLVFYTQSMTISETRMDATAAGIKRGDVLKEIDGKPVNVVNFPEIYKSTMVPFSMKFNRPKPSNCATCGRGALGCIIS
mmetsp:Transcript_30630/g.53756  ORF Transcript_30630/g.53756 Transcript_30630/m.53756 type:complete len:340 (-) Transcript_30630:389-1408(-)